MDTQTTTPVPPADPAIPEYTAEIRFGVVMYGGVSRWQFTSNCRQNRAADAQKHSLPKFI